MLSSVNVLLLVFEEDGRAVCSCAPLSKMKTAWFQELFPLAART